MRQENQMKFRGHLDQSAYYHIYLCFLGTLCQDAEGFCI